MKAGGRRYWAVEKLASLSVRWPRLVVLVHLLFVAGALVGVTQLRDEEDLLVFLPRSDPDVQRFFEVSQRFGALRVALIGVEAPPGDDIFAAETIRGLGRATESLRNTEGVDRVLSLTSIEDLLPSPLGVEVTALVPGPPADRAAQAALRTKVLSRPSVVGQLVSADGRAALLMVYLAPGVGTTRVARALRTAASTALPGLQLYYAGAPFAGDAIYGEARRDMLRLSPIAIFLLFFVVVLSFRDWVGVGLTIGCVGLATLAVLGAMGAIGDRFTVATATLPVILFAAGSAFPIYLLGRYYLIRETKSPEEAVRDAVATVAVPLTIDTATTSIGFLAFIVMSIPPMRAFGVACGIGIWFVWATTLTLVPAVLVLWPRRSPPREQLAWLGRALQRIWSWSERRAALVSLAGLILLAASLALARDLDVRMEPRAFFSRDSEPWRTEAFLEERFGGASFVEVELRGDLTEPATLRELARLVEYAQTLPGVTQVQSILDPLLLVAEGMGLGRRLPETQRQAGNLFFFLVGQAGMESLVTHDRSAALVHVRVRGEPRDVVNQLDQYVKTRIPPHPGPQTATELARRLSGATPRPLLAEEILSLVMPPELGVAGEGETDPRLTQVERSLALLAERVLGRPPSAAERARLWPMLDELYARIPIAEVAVHATVAGEPVLDRGFSHAVATNQLRSTIVAVFLTIVFLTILFRSLRLALIAWFPAQLTMGALVVAMTLSHTAIDLGTAIVTGTAIGVGADFAMYYLWCLRTDPPEQVSREVGPVGLVAVLLIAAGFGVLALGRSPITRLFGVLAASSTLLSALITVLWLPALRALRLRHRSAQT